MGKFLAERHPNVATENTSSRDNKYTELTKKINKKKKDLPVLDLETKEEEGLENVKVAASKRESSRTIVQRRQNLYDREEDDEIEEEYEIEDAKETQKSGNQDKISDIIVGLLFKNKINSKNAFDVPLVNVQDLSDFKNIKGDFAWKKLSSSLDAGAKVYGYRVDSLHSDTYKIRNGLNRSEVAADAKGEGKSGYLANGGADEEETDKKAAKRKFKGGESTLEKNVANINATKYDLEFDIDPLFTKTSAKFDDHGAKGLLMNTIKIDSDVSAMLDSSKQSQYWKKRKLRCATYGDIHSLKGVSSYGNPRSSMNFDKLFSCQLCPEMTSLAQDLRENSKDIFDVSRIRESRRSGLVMQSTSEIRLQTHMMNEIVDVERDIMNEIDAAIQNNPEEQVDFLNATHIGLAENVYSQQIAMQEQEDIDLNQGYEAMQMENDLPEALPLSQEGPDRYSLINGEATNEILEEFTANQEDEQLTQNMLLKPLNFLNLDEKLSMIGFGKEFINPQAGKNWMQPDDWKLPKKQNIKAVVKLSDLLPELNIFRSKKFSKSLQEGAINFDLDEEEDFNSVILPENTKFKSSYTKEVGMLPKDFHIVQSLFSSYAMKDPSTFASLRRSDDDYNNDGDYYEYDGDSHQNHNSSAMSKVLNDLAEKHSSKAKNQMMIKELKTKLWDKLESKIPQTAVQGETGNPMKIKKRAEVEPDTIAFSDVYDQLPQLLGVQNRSRVSLQTCFVTILHLANEKTLRFQRTEEEGDFIISKDLLMS